MSRKLIYKFQEKDNKDFTFKVEKHPTNNYLISTIKQGVNIVTKPVLKLKADPSTFVIQNISNILDQGNLGDCVANAFKFAISSQTNKRVQISRLFLYAICRILDNTPLNQDSGTTVRTASSSILKYGIINETVYDYNISLFSNLPPLSVFKSATYLQHYKYTFINQNELSIKQCLIINKTPIIFGFMVYSSFMSTSVTNTGIVPMPDLSTETLMGGHCTCIIGYDDVTKMFTCVNSWGTNWGINGKFYMPYAYLVNSNLASDFCYLSVI